MKKIYLLFASLILTLILSGCVADGGKVTAREVLKRDKDADIIQSDGFIFSNVTDLEWFDDEKEEISFSKDYFLGEIKKQTTSI